MEFYSRTHLPATIAQPKCEKIVPTYGKKVDAEGKVKVIETGKSNIYEKIQASKDETLVYNILDRFNNGDINALNQRQGHYGDFTQEPKTLVEWQQKRIDAENYFNSLPLNVRREFDHSLDDFLNTAIKGKLSERHEYFKPPKPVEDAMKQVANQQALNQVQQTVVQAPNIVTGGSANE